MKKEKVKRKIGKKEGESRMCYKFRLYPTFKQIEKFNFTREQCKRMYNYLLWELKQPYEKIKPFIPLIPELNLCIDNQFELVSKTEREEIIQDILKDYYKLIKINRSYIQSQVKPYRLINPEMMNIQYSVLQYQNWKLFGNLKGLSGSKKKGNKVGLLRSKRFREFNTFTYSNPQSFKIIDGKLRLNWIGDIKMRIHRKVRGNLKQATITEKNKKWYVNIITDYDLKRISEDKWIGIDLGIKNYLFDSDKNKISKPNILRGYLKQLKKENQNLARKKIRSENWKKQKDRLSKLHEKILKSRKDFLDKLSDDYVKKYKYIVVENLNIKEMVEKKDKFGNRKRKVVDNKNVNDAAWNMFIQMLNYKLKQSSGILIKVDPKNTTQTCSGCGDIKDGENKLTLRDRVYKCDKCGLKIDRDYNASLNILERGKKIFKKPKDL